MNNSMCVCVRVEMAKKPVKGVSAGITRNGDRDGDRFGPHGDGGCPRLVNGGEGGG